MKNTANPITSKKQETKQTAKSFPRSHKIFAEKRATTPPRLLALMKKEIIVLLDSGTMVSMRPSALTQENSHEKTKMKRQAMAPYKWNVPTNAVTNKIAINARMETTIEMTLLT